MFQTAEVGGCAMLQCAACCTIIVVQFHKSRWSIDPKGGHTFWVYVRGVSLFEVYVPKVSLFFHTHTFLHQV